MGPGLQAVHVRGVLPQAVQDHLRGRSTTALHGVRAPVSRLSLRRAPGSPGAGPGCAAPRGPYLDHGGDGREADRVPGGTVNAGRRRVAAQAREDHGRSFRPHLPPPSRRGAAGPGALPRADRPPGGPGCPRRRSPRAAPTHPRPAWKFTLLHAPTPDASANTSAAAKRGHATASTSAARAAHLQRRG